MVANKKAHPGSLRLYPYAGITQIRFYGTLSGSLAVPAQSRNGRTTPVDLIWWILMGVSIAAFFGKEISELFNMGFFPYRKKKGL